LPETTLPQIFDTAETLPAPKNNENLESVKAISYSDFDSDEDLYQRFPAKPVNIRRKFVGHDSSVQKIAKIARKMMFGEANNLEGKLCLDFKLKTI